MVKMITETHSMTMNSSSKWLAISGTVSSVRLMQEPKMKNVTRLCQKRKLVWVGSVKARCMMACMSILSGKCER